MNDFTSSVYPGSPRRTSPDGSLRTANAPRADRLSAVEIRLVRADQALGFALATVAAKFNVAPHTVQQCTKERWDTHEDGVEVLSTMRNA